MINHRGEFSRILPNCCNGIAIVFVFKLFVFVLVTLAQSNYLNLVSLTSAPRNALEISFTLASLISTVGADPLSSTFIHDDMLLVIQNYLGYQKIAGLFLSIFFILKTVYAFITTGIFDRYRDISPLRNSNVGSAAKNKILNKH